MRVAYTAGEAIGPDLFVFYRSIGINLKQLYGSTETAVFVCLQPDHEVRNDTVGVPIEGVEIKVTDAGEVLVRSPGLLKEYYKDPAATAEVLGADGWYRTGDAGFIDAAGHLKIIDRAKDVGRIVGGATTARCSRPSTSRTSSSSFRTSRRRSPSATSATRSAPSSTSTSRRSATGPRSGTCRTAATPTWRRSPPCSQLVRECVEKVNADLAADERLAGSQISRFLVLHKELDADDGELTRTRKVRRGFIAERYQLLVDALYGGKSEQFVETAVRFEDGRTGKVAATLKIIDVPTFAPVGKAA